MESAITSTRCSARHDTVKELDKQWSDCAITTYSLWNSLGVISVLFPVLENVMGGGEGISIEAVKEDQ